MGKSDPVAPGLLAELARVKALFQLRAVEMLLKEQRRAAPAEGLPEAVPDPSSPSHPPKGVPTP
jgi:hypothetical protein